MLLWYNWCTVKYTYLKVQCDGFLHVYTGNPLQYSCRENPKDRGALQATIHGVARAGHDLATKPSPYL